MVGIAIWCKGQPLAHSIPMPCRIKELIAVLGICGPFHALGVVGINSMSMPKMGGILVGTNEVVHSNGIWLIWSTDCGG